MVEATQKEMEDEETEEDETTKHLDRESEDLEPMVKKTKNADRSSESPPEVSKSFFYPNKFHLSVRLENRREIQIWWVPFPSEVQHAKRPKWPSTCNVKCIRCSEPPIHATARLSALLSF